MSDRRLEIERFQRQVAAMLKEPAQEGARSKTRYRSTATGYTPKRYRDLASGIDSQVLSKTGWAVLFGENEKHRVGRHLDRLIVYRKQQAGTRFRERIIPKDIEGVCVSGQRYLWKHLKEAPGVVDVDKLPYYVLIVASPEEVPFEFQYELAVNRAVGRLYFDDREDYGRYAAAVLAVEEKHRHRSGSQAERSIGFFHVPKDDEASRTLDAFLVDPVAEALQQESPFWKTQVHRTGYADELRAVLSGRTGRASAWVVSCHGKKIAFGSENQLARQGGLSCLDGRVYADDMHAQEPISSPMLGKVIFLLACFGAGTPKQEEYEKDSSLIKTFKDGEIPEIGSLAPESFIAKLPQRLLANGVLGVFGHVNRGFTSSFRWLFEESKSEASRTFTDMLARFLSGNRLGHALRPMSRRCANISTHFLPFLQDWIFDRDPDYRELSRQWLAWIDSRNFILLGDPAVDIWGDELGGASADHISGRTQPIHFDLEVVRRLGQEAKRQGLSLNSLVQRLWEPGFAADSHARQQIQEKPPTWEDDSVPNTVTSSEPVLKPSSEPVLKPLRWAVQSGGARSHRVDSSNVDLDSRLRDALSGKTAIREVEQADADLIFRLQQSGSTRGTRTFRDGRAPSPAQPAFKAQALDRSGATYGPELDSGTPDLWMLMRDTLLEAATSHQLHQLAQLNPQGQSTLELELTPGWLNRARIENTSTSRLYIELGIWRSGRWRSLLPEQVSVVESGAEIQLADVQLVGTGRSRGFAVRSSERCHILMLSSSNSPVDLARALAGDPRSELGKFLVAALRDHRLIDLEFLRSTEGWALEVRSFWHQNSDH